MPANSSKPKVGSGGSGHGDLRGASAARSPQFEGSFGRMFRALPPASFDVDDLARLADVNQMLSPPEVAQDANGKDRRDDKGFLVPSATDEDQVDDEENFGIPAGYSYLGQFIDHHITFDPASSLQ